MEQGHNLLKKAAKGENICQLSGWSLADMIQILPTLIISGENGQDKPLDRLLPTVMIFLPIYFWIHNKSFIQRIKAGTKVVIATVYQKAHNELKDRIFMDPDRFIRELWWTHWMHYHKPKYYNEPSLIVKHWCWVVCPEDLREDLVWSN